MYLIINHFAFEYPKSNISDGDVIDTFNNLGYLFIELKKLNVDLIIHSKLSQIQLNGKFIRDFIQSLENKNVKTAVMSLLSKIKPICSDTDIAFENNEIIAFDNCREETEQIDVCYTFLSCALFHLNPILTINSLCSKNQFLNESIKIVCDNNSFELANYKLVPYKDVLEKIEIYQGQQLEDKYNALDNWNDYKEFININLKYCKVTDACIEYISKKFSYDNSYSAIIRNKIKRMNHLIEQDSNSIMSMDFSSLGLGTPESDTRRTKLEKSHAGIKDYSSNDVFLNWHDYIQKDFRLYFEKDNEFVSFVYFEKKID